MSTLRKNDRKGSRISTNRKIPAVAYAGGALLLIIILVVSISVDFNPIGEEIEVMDSALHVPEGTDPGPYNSNPPTSGQHYEEHFTSEFFVTNEYEYPEGFLVHNLEHGYVIFWYNCDVLDESACETLKDEIQSVMTRVNMDKVIAYPWPGIDQPIVMTSWGRLLGFDDFDTELAYRFARKYHNRAPEPQGE